MIRYTYDARGQMVAIYPDGTVVPVLGAEQSAPQTTGTGMAPVTSEDAAASNGSSDNAGYAGNSGYSRDYARSYRPRQPDFGSDYPTTPAYADGSRHPLQGGNPRVAGGLFAQQSAQNGGFDTREQVNVPGGSAAGPFETRAANPARGGGGFSGGSGGSGGGGGASAVYNAWRAKLEGKLMPGGSSYGSYDDSYKAPKEKKEPMRGPYAHGLDPDQALGLAFRPTALLDRAVPGLSAGSPLRDRLAELPAYQLGILGTRNYKGTPQALANSVGRFYHDAGVNNDLPDFEDVFRNLTNPKKHGGIADIFGGVKAPKGVQKATGYQYEYGHEPLAAADAAGTFENLLGGALSLLPTATAAKYTSGASRLIDQATLKAMKKPAGKGKPIYRTVGRKLFG